MLMKIIKYLWLFILWLVCLFILLIWWYYFYQQYIQDDDILIQEYSKYFDRVEVDYMDVWNKKIHYMDVWDPNDQLVMLIHGAPGDISNRNKVLEVDSLHTWFRFIIPDRIWYGRSETWDAELSIKAHSDVLMELLLAIQHDDERLPIIVGHSYGASIAAKMVMDYSDSLMWSIVASGALDPDNERVFAISHLIKYWPFTRLVGPMIDVTNNEKLAHSESLRTEVQNYQDISKPFHVIHGTEDSLVPYINVQYMQDRVPTEYRYHTAVEWANHPLQFTNPKILAESIVWFSLLDSQ